MIDFQRLFKLLIRRSWIILLLSSLAGGAAWYYYTNKTVPLYQANASLYALTRNYSDISGKVNSDSLLVNRMLVKDYRELIKSYKVTSTVVEELGLNDIPPEAIAARVNISSKNDSNVLLVTVLDTKPDRARDIANSISRAFINKINELTNGNNLSILDVSKTPVLPINLDHRMKIITAFMAVFLLSVTAIYFLELTNTKLQTVEEAEKRLECNVIGIIPKMSIK
ncbi:MAG: Wzz/FepE/Etk N-terminal domain-containing protein [Clostridia bacterium]|nr:Wzz/FepE/Etk N-terminal domain-containing protein [Clostridia bacterium]